jgi:hypothetical protein
MMILALKILQMLVFAKTFAYSPNPGNVTATVGPYFYKTHFDGSASGANSAWRMGEAILVNGDISEHGQLEADTFHMVKSFFRDQNGQFIGEQTEMVQINLGYRRWLSESFSAAFSFYSSYSMESPKIVHSDFQPENAIDTSARDTTEYGFDFSIQSELWHEKFWALTTELRYSASVTPKKDEKADLYGVIIGLRYLMHEKGVNPTSSK